MAVAAAFIVLTGCEDQHEKEEIVPPAKAFVELSESVIEVKSTGSDEPATRTVTITSSEDWKISGASLWIRLSAIKGKSGQEVTFTIDPNNTREVKTCTFEVSAGNSEPVLLEVKSIPPDYLNLLSDRSVTVPADGGDVTVRYESNIETGYEFSPEVSWITETSSENGQFAFHVEPNEDGENRSVTITLKAEGVKPVSVTVSQAKKIVAGDTPYFNGEDEELVLALQHMGWISEESTEDGYEVLGPGLEGQLLELTNDNYEIETVSGLGAFPALTSITIDNSMIWAIDLADCTGITSLEFEGSGYTIASIAFGNNPITTFTMEVGYYVDWSGETFDLVISGANIETINANRFSNFNEGMGTLDVSGCPKLKELHAKRGTYRTGSKPYCADALKTIYVSQAQLDAYNDGTLSIERYEQFSQHETDKAPTTEITVR